MTDIPGFNPAPLDKPTVAPNAGNDLLWENKGLDAEGG
jgi:hypothetical protein